MNRRRFLSFLGLAPVAAFVPSTPEPGLDVIRTITIRAETSGLDASVKELSRLMLARSAALYGPSVGLSRLLGPTSIEDLKGVL